MLLLETRDGYVPAPRSYELPAEPGIKAGRRVPCGCARKRDEGLEIRLVGDLRCLLCEGRGWRLRIPSLDGDVDREEGQRDERGIVFDEYTYGRALKAQPARRRLFGHLERRTMEPWAMDAEIARLRRLELVRRGEIAAERYGWECARAFRDRSGSYPELDGALELLRDADEDAYELVTHAYVEGRYGRPPRLPAAAAALVVRGLVALERAMPAGEIRLPGSLEERLRAERKRQTVGELLEQGWKASRIARELGMTVEAVRREARRLARRAGDPTPPPAWAAGGSSP